MRNIFHIANLSFIIFISLRPHQFSSRDLPSLPDSILQTCEGTLYKESCRRALASFPTNDGADLHDLAKRLIKYASLNGSYVEDIITQWLRATTEDDFIQQRLYDCSQNYLDAVEQLEDSLLAIDDKFYGDAKTWIAAAMDDVETCVEDCSHDSPLVEMNISFSQLCSNALAIVNMLAT